MTWSVARDSSCTRGLLWRLDVPTYTPIDDLVGALMARGFAEHGTPGMVHDLRGDDETSVVIVPRTRRVQLRLSYLIEHERRATYAAAIAEHISGWVAAVNARSS